MRDTWKLYNEFDQIKTLHVTVGLPYSGKSAWCRLKGWPVVSPDAIRLSVHGTRFNDHAELMVWTLAQYMVQSLFIAGHANIIVDGCHTIKKRRDIWRTNAGAGQHARWLTHFHTFTTPKGVCLGRAAEKQDRHIIDVIYRMHDQWEDVVNDGAESENFVLGAETIHDYDAKKDICIPVEKTYKTAGKVVDAAPVEGKENPQGCTQSADRQP